MEYGIIPPLKSLPARQCGAKAIAGFPVTNGPAYSVRPTEKGSDSRVHATTLTARCSIDAGLLWLRLFFI